MGRSKGWSTWGDGKSVRQAVREYVVQVGVRLVFVSVFAQEPASTLYLEPRHLLALE